MVDTKGTEEAGDATQQEPGNKDLTADGQQKVNPDAEGKDEIAGLKAAATAERKKRQDAETDAKLAREQLAIAMANKPAVQQQQPQNDILASMGIDVEDDDYLSAGDVKRVLATFMGQVQSALSSSTFLATHPDFAEVVGVQVGQNFQYAPPLKSILEKNPALEQVILQSPNGAMVAYEIAKNDPQYLKDKTESGKSDEIKAAEKAEAKLKEANKQLSGSAAQGGGNLDRAAAIAAMTDEEFKVHNEKIMKEAM